MQLGLFAEPEAPVSDVAPNGHGVYPGDAAETLALPNPRKNWHGGPLATIRLLHLAAGWIWATGVMLPSRGHSEPLMASRPVPTRAEALAAAIDRIAGKYADDPQIQRWVRSLAA